MTSKLNALVLDEDLDSRIAARRALQRSSFQVAGEAGFGAEAVSLANELKPDIILIAVEDPAGRPLETVEALANVLPNTPVVFYASSDEAEAIRRAVVYGARDYLIKPLQAPELERALLRSLENEEKRQMRLAGQMASAAVRGTVITVAGAKGGIGKTVTAVNLALALRRVTNGKVALVDADTQFGDVPTMLDIHPSSGLTQLTQQLETLDRTNVAGFLTEAQEGVQVLAGPEDDEVWQKAGPEGCAKIIDTLALNFDYVILDTSGAVDRFVRAFVEKSTLVLMMTTGEVSSVRGLKAALLRLKGWSVPQDKVKVVLNRGARADGFQVSDLETATGQPIFWEIPRDKEVGRSVQLGLPLIVGKPTSAASRGYLALASAIGGNLHRANSSEERRGFFARRRKPEPGKATS